MTLSAGSRVGPFEILSPLGAGGMGEVYRARDNKLGRDVAIKVLPAALAGSSERLARLRREAKLLASLNHPHIAAIYDLQESGGACALVMELVEGLTLQGRLAKGALPLSEALDAARQIAEALEYAHEHGIIHRDLKPANIKLTPQGSVKVLDFGLAKALADESLSPDLSSSPTETSAPGEGVVLGTAAYMSPEQAQGKAVDRRTDIWSFGVVLYELLTGKRLFARATGAETMALVITSEPDLSQLPATTPPSLRRLLRRCLEKDQTRRLHDIGDARLEIEEAESERSVELNVAATARRRTWLWTGGLIAATALGGLGAALLLRSPPNPSTTVRRVTLALPTGVELFSPEASFQHLAVSADGRRVAFMGAPHGSEGGRNEGQRLYVQGIDDLEARAIPGTENAVGPFFSPDGQWLAFRQQAKLRKIRLDAGEAPVTIVDMPKAGGLRGASWGPDGTIVFTPGPFEGLWQVPANGGMPRALTQPDARHGEVSHRWPQVLADGRHVVFTVQRQGERAIWQESRIALLSLDTGKWRDVVEGTGYGRYSSTGHLVFARTGMLFAVAFDLTRGAASGPAAPVLDDVQMNLVGHLYADFDVSASGSLVYMPGFKRTIARSLLSVDRQGQARLASSARRDYRGPRVSPDGRQLVVSIEPDPGSLADLWRLDLEKDAWTRLTFGGGADAEWSPNTRWLAFRKPTLPELMKMPADGSAGPERLFGFSTQTVFITYPNAWSPDGHELVFSAQPRETAWDVGVLSLETREPRWILSAPYIECCAALSPDGRFMAYGSTDSNRMDVYVRPYPGPGGERYVISSDGGMQPRWSRDGRELYYRRFGDRPKLMAVPVETHGRFHAGAPRPLFDDVYSERSATFTRAAYDVTPDGRFVFVEEPPAAPAPNRLVLIPDWKRELEGRLGAARP